MLKLLGSICILTGCIGWGGSKIREEKEKVQNLRELIRIIKRIQNEISYGKHTLPEICLILAEYSRTPYRECFRMIYERSRRQEDICLEEIWEQEFEQGLRTACLPEEEKGILQNLLQNLGIQEEKYQAESIGQSLDMLIRTCRQSEDAYEGKSRVIFSLSILTGMFLTILLL